MASYGEVVLAWSQFGIQMRSALHVVHPGSVLPDGWEEVALGAIVAAMDEWDDFMADSLNLDGFYYREVTGSAPFPAALFAPLGLTGGNSAAGLPTTVAATLAFQTEDLLIRRGHMQVPGHTASSLASGLVSTAARTNILTGWAAYTTTLSTENLTPAVVRMYNTMAGVTTGAPIVSQLVRTAWGTVRSRKPGTGI